MNILLTPSSNTWLKDDHSDSTLTRLIHDFHGQLNSDSTHLNQSRVKFDSRLMSRAQSCCWAFVLYFSQKTVQANESPVVHRWQTGLWLPTVRRRWRSGGHVSCWSAWSWSGGGGLSRLSRVTCITLPIIFNGWFCLCVRLFLFVSFRYWRTWKILSFRGHWGES